MTTGYRCVLIYNLVVKPNKSMPQQPTDQSIAVELAKMMHRFGDERDKDYPDPSYWFDSKESKWPGKPNKLVLVLSHAYTKKGLREAEGMNALKGTDRAIAELIAAAMKVNLDATRENMNDKNKLNFDAVTTIIRVWDWGEFTDTYPHECQTDGEIFPLVPWGVASTIGNQGPLNLSNKSVKEEWSKSNHRIPIYSHELLLTKEESKQYFRGREFNGSTLVCQDDPKEIEFLGNSLPYPGRFYARAAIILWPKSNREKIEIEVMNSANKMRLAPSKDDHPNYDGTYPGMIGREGEPVPEDDYDY